MDIVKTFDLVAAHLPNLKSLFFAAEKARNLLESDRHGHRFNLHQILDRVASSGLRPDQRAQLINEVSNRQRPKPHNRLRLKRLRRFIWKLAYSPTVP